MAMKRRDFVRSANLASLAGSIPVAPRAQGAQAPLAAVRPVVVSSDNGLQATARAMQSIKEEADALDAVIAGVNIVEDDPNDNSVGYGGLPNVGDSPILGTGLYVDNEVGAAGSTGRGEANLLACSSVIMVECMRLGKSPQDACVMACERIARRTKEKRLLDAKGLPRFNLNFYAITRAGDFCGAAIWRGGKFAVNTGEPESRLVHRAYLYKRER